MKKNRKICKTPFSLFITTPVGEVYPCCSEFTNYSFGNIYKESIEEILHGERITKFRESILNGEYKYCNKKLCKGFIPNQFVDISEISDVNQYPLEVNLSFDTICNARCVMCRDKQWILPKDIKGQLEESIEKVFIPLLKNAKLLVLNCDGEFFASKESMLLVKRTAELYPNLRYEILTNGILCTEKKLQELGITDKIQRITMSLHASTPETHEKVMRVKNKFNTVINNIEYLVKLKKEGKLSDIGVVFVLSSVNYKDLPGYAELLEKYNIGGDVWQFRDWQNSKMCSNYDNFDITNPNHPEYNNLLEILRNPAIKSELLYKNDKIEQLYNIANNV